MNIVNEVGKPLDADHTEIVPQNVQNSRFTDPFINHVLFDHANQLNDDHAYWFKLRTDHVNRFVDCAAPLIGMALRVKTHQASHHDIPRLYKQCVDEIKAIEVELVEAGFEYATIVAYRYVLCTYIDEIVMSTAWGAQSEWTSKSLLVHFHNEAWGGEKIFLIVERLEKEVERYYDLLEFIFLCLCLGLEGKFKVLDGKQDNYNKIISSLYDKLVRYKNWEPEPLTKPYTNIIDSRNFLPKEWTVFKVVSCILIVVAIAYVLYFLQLTWKGEDVVNELRNIL